VIVENVVDIATNHKYSSAWRAWQQGLVNLGYDFKVVSLNSMHAQALGMPAPQSRDRLYVVAWPKGNTAPDVERFIRPKAWCSCCETIVESRQVWKNNRTVGKYRTQYVYICRGCKTLVEPAWLPASSAIDWLLKGTRIGDRDKPLSEKTRARIAAGIARYWRPMLTEAAGNTWDASDPKHPGFGDIESYYRIWPTEDPMRSLTTVDRYALITQHRFEYRVKPDTEPLATFAAQGNHQGVVTPGDVEAAEAMVDDCTFRMLQPHEIGKGMAFPDDYIVKGSKRDQVKGYGNAVTPPAARDLVGALAESLGHEVTT
jgi:DNA (cytosine-5)-methyltransferase 1